MSYPSVLVRCNRALAGFIDALVLSALLLLAVALAPASALASTAGVASAGSVLAVAENSPELNGITISRESYNILDPSQRRYRVDDQAFASQVATAGCTVDGSDVVCNDNGITQINVNAGEGGDYVTLESSVPSSVSSSLVGGPGNDILTGGNGADTLEGGAGGDDLTGGGGTDIASYADHSDAESAYVDIGAGPNEVGQPSGCNGFDDGSPLDDRTSGCRDNVRDGIENLRGGQGDDFLTGNASANVLNGGDGGDQLDGGGGPDDLIGGADFGNKAVYVTRTADVTVSIGDGANDGETNEGDDVRFDVQSVTGGSGNDTLTGDSGSNLLNGGPGNDTLDGGFSSDSLNGGDGSDTVTYATRSEVITANLDGGDGNGGPNDLVMFTSDTISTDVENLIGGSGPDTLTGDANANVLTGGLGVDTLKALGGDDLYNALDGVTDNIDCTGGGNDTGSLDTTPAESYTACDPDADAVQVFFDACPTQAGTLANGCPAAVITTPLAGATGKRAAAVKKCKKKHGAAKKRCIKKAKKLPV